MPIHINEIVVKTVVEPASTQGKGGSTPEESQQALVREAVERVLELLRSREER